MKMSRAVNTAFAGCTLALVSCGAPQQPSLNPQTLALPDATGSKSYRIVHSFFGSGGTQPESALLYYQGAFYGTASEGGDRKNTHDGKHGYGTIFKISPDGHETVLYRFTGGTDGWNPEAGLTELGGTFYGTTHGTGGACYVDRCGTIFSISPSGTGFTTLYNFTGKADGGEPNANLTARNGVLYGITDSWDGGGCLPSDGGCGTLFAFTPSSGAFKTLDAFPSYKGDGSRPSGSLVLLGGTLYGTTLTGGASGAGSVYSITSAGKESVVYSCAGNGDCYWPVGLTALNGKLYGVSQYEKAFSGAGDVFSVTPDGHEHTIFSFPNSGNDGTDPNNVLTFAGDTFYGSTARGGSNNEGTIFSITPAGNFTLLHSFLPPKDSGRPNRAMTFYDGALYGTLPKGGARGAGALYALTP